MILCKRKVRDAITFFIRAAMLRVAGIEVNIDARTAGKPALDIFAPDEAAALRNRELLLENLCPSTNCVKFGNGCSELQLERLATSLGKRSSDLFALRTVQSGDSTSHVKTRRISQQITTLPALTTSRVYTSATRRFQSHDR